MVFKLPSIAGLITVLALSCSVPATVDPTTAAPVSESVIPSTEIVADPSQGTEVSSSRPRDVFRMPVTHRLMPDPIHADDSDSFMLLAEIYSGLMRLADDRGAGSIEEDLAATVQTSDDGHRYTFVLKSGIMFSDDSPVLASHFKWSWERALASGTSSRVIETLGVILGAQDVAEGRSADLAGVEVVDERTLVVTLESPRSDFLMRMAGPVAVVLNPDNVTRWETDFGAAKTGYNPEFPPFDFQVMPAGTGPFALAEFDYLEGQCEIVRNENYVGNPVALDRVQFVSDEDVLESTSATTNDGTELIDPTSEVQTLWDAATEGQIHAFESVIDPSETFGLNVLEDWVIEENATGFASRFVAFNIDLPPFDDIEFRRALIASYPLAAISEILGEPVPTGLAPETFGIQQHQLGQPSSSPSQAQRILAGSEYPNVTEFDMPFYHSAGSASGVWSTLLSAWNSTLGIVAKPYQVSDDVATRVAELGSVGLIPVTVRSQFPDRLIILSEFADLFRNHGESHAGDSIRQMIMDAAIELDPARRNSMISEIEALIRDLAVALPYRWDYGIRYVVTPRSVHGYEVPLFHRSRFKHVRFTDIG